MGRRSERMTTLATSQARFKAAADLLRWALNSEIKGVIAQEEVYATIAKIEAWADLAWKALREVESK